MNALNRFFGRDEGEEGQAVVLFAIMMLALLFAVGLAIDAGQLYSAKRTEQEAADAAGLSELDYSAVLAQILNEPAEGRKA